VKVLDAASKVAIKPSSHQAMAPPTPSPLHDGLRPRPLAATHRLAPDSSSAAVRLTPRRTLAGSELVPASRAVPGSRRKEGESLTATMCGRTVLLSLQICVPGFTKSARASTGAPGHELGLAHLMGWCGRWATRPLWGPSRLLATTAE
jgi:hypothetical protein